MSILFRLLLFFVSLLAVVVVVRQIRHAKMQIEDTIFWVLLSLMTLVLSIFPGIAIWAANVLSIQSPANFVFLCFLFVLIMQLFRMSIRLSRLDDKLKTLTQEMAIAELENKNDQSKAREIQA